MDMRFCSFFSLFRLADDWLVLFVFVSAFSRDRIYIYRISRLRIGRS
jgi:hypothetical protein